MWNPGAARRKFAAAEFVADDGWQLAGRVPAAEAERIAAAPRGPVPIDARRRVRTLELGSRWADTVPVAVLIGGLLSLIALGILLLPVGGGARGWIAVAGVLAPVAAWLTAGPRTTHSDRPAAEAAA